MKSMFATNSIKYIGYNISRHVCLDIYIYPTTCFGYGTTPQWSMGNS